jgi:hypothetical protein
LPAFLATRGATAFDGHRGCTSKAGYYKKYFGDWFAALTTA